MELLFPGGTVVFSYGLARPRANLLSCAVDWSPRPSNEGDQRGRTARDFSGARGQAQLANQAMPSPPGKVPGCRPIDVQTPPGFNGVHSATGWSVHCQSHERHGDGNCGLSIRAAADGEMAPRGHRRHLLCHCRREAIT